MLNRISALLILFALCANSLLIYRSKHHHRPKLVCYAVPPDAKIDPQRHPSYPETTGTGAEPHPTKDKLTSSSPPNDLKSHVETVRSRRDAKDFEEMNFNGEFDIDILGGIPLSNKNLNKIRKKLIKTCEALNMHHA